MTPEPCPYWRRAGGSLKRPNGSVSSLKAWSRTITVEAMLTTAGITFEAVPLTWFWRSFPPTTGSNRPAAQPEEIITNGRMLAMRNRRIEKAATAIAAFLLDHKELRNVVA